LLGWTIFANVSHAIAIRGGDDGTRTRDLCRDRGEVNHWPERNQ
jgi:hypothetical protein